MDRWEKLFAELEAGDAAGEIQGLHGEVQELARAERSAIRLVDRLAQGVGSEIHLELVGGCEVRGKVIGAAREWVALETRPGLAMVQLEHVVFVKGLTQRARGESVRLSVPNGGANGGAEEARSVVASSGLSYVGLLRRLELRGQSMRIVANGLERTGVLHAVGFDHVECEPWRDPYVQRTAVRSGGGARFIITTKHIAAVLLN